MMSASIDAQASRTSCVFCTDCLSPKRRWSRENIAFALERSADGRRRQSINDPGPMYLRGAQFLKCSSSITHRKSRYRVIVHRPVTPARRQAQCFNHLNHRECVPRALAAASPVRRSWFD
jgi:hypothetical protein